MKSFIIADTHFGHVNINKYEPIRQTWGKDHIESTNTIIKAWNSVVGPEDWVYHLGDFAMGNPKLWQDYRDKLNGNIVLICGNHDRRPENWLKTKDMVVRGVLCVPVDEYNIYMRHSPYDFLDVEFNDQRSLLLYGHIHSAVLNESSKIRYKGVCVSIEQLPTAPAPILLQDIINKYREERNNKKCTNMTK